MLLTTSYSRFWVVIWTIECNSVPKFQRCRFLMPTSSKSTFTPSLRILTLSLIDLRSRVSSWLLLPSGYAFSEIQKILRLSAISKSRVFNGRLRRNRLSDGLWELSHSHRLDCDFASFPESFSIKLSLCKICKGLYVAPQIQCRGVFSQIVVKF